jgi:hypothetical protein
MQELYDMSIYRKKSRHPKELLKVYRLFLMGLPDEEILNAGISASDIQKCKHFHSYTTAGKASYRVGEVIGIEKHVAKKMLAMFEEWKAGMPLLSDSCKKPNPQIKLCLTMLLDGASETMLKEKCSEYEIQKAREFMKYADSDMLTSTIAKEAEIPKCTVKSLLKVYRDKQAAVRLPSSEPHIEYIVVAGGQKL